LWSRRQESGEVFFGMHVVAEDRQGCTKRPEAGEAELYPL